ncbi:MAG: tRNA guanosine(34) transglycosylase Tgt [Deltaproteobacteria bacterium]|nr:tRNA guanosine(34) transglycosylase Tgt [Deltaproteobacteria bacterium]
MNSYLMRPFRFHITARDGQARTGRLQTAHGVIETPAFVPVATWAAVQVLSAADLQRAGAQVLITNAYHLHLQPGGTVIRDLGGLHTFMGWSGPIMIDSGGFQIFSLGAGRTQGVGKVGTGSSGKRRKNEFPKTNRVRPLVRVDEDGAEFISYLDGSRYRFTPENVVEASLDLGADLIMALDECTSPLHSYERTRESLARTHRWALRALDVFRRLAPEGRALFGIVQGGDYEDLRRESSRFIGGLDFDGVAVGGSLGQSKADIGQVLKWTVPGLPEGKPRHLLGIGWVEDVLTAVSLGIDLQDCVAPTLLARTGTFLHKREKRFRLRIRNREHRRADRPVEEDCTCPTCRTCSRAYLRHLFMAGEPLAVHLASVHNLYFMETLMASLRKAIRERRLARWIEDLLTKGSLGLTKP